MNNNPKERLSFFWGVISIFRSHSASSRAMQNRGKSPRTRELCEVKWLDHFTAMGNYCFHFQPTGDGCEPKQTECRPGRESRVKARYHSFALHLDICHLTDHAAHKVTRFSHCFLVMVESIVSIVFTRREMEDMQSSSAKFPPIHARMARTHTHNRPFHHLLWKHKNYSATGPSSKRSKGLPHNRSL